MEVIETLDEEKDRWTFEYKGKKFFILKSDMMKIQLAKKIVKIIQEG